MSPGVLLSSGLIAGGTIAGVVAVLIGLGWAGMANVGKDAFGEIVDKDWFSMIPFVALCLLLIYVGRKSAPKGAV